jgi:L-lactate dehydrogenase complex protein LldG
MTEPKSKASLREQFRNALLRAGGEYHAVRDLREAETTIANILAEAGASRVVVEDSPITRGLLPTSSAHTSTLAHLLPDKLQFAEADAGLTGVLTGIAATGTLVLAASRMTPRSTSLLPPLHIAVLRAEDLVGTLADSFARIATHDLPSQIIHITGPSRTGDIEHDLTRGVHGPQRVVVICLIGETE